MRRHLLINKQTLLTAGLFSFFLAVAGSIFTNHANAGITASQRAVLQKTQKQLVTQHADKHAVRTGQKAPNFTLPSASGKILSLKQLLKNGPVVLIFYRGGWCPYCNEQLQAYQKRLGDIHAAGGQLVAISPEKPDHTIDTAKKNKLGFDVLSDTGNKAATDYGLLFKLPKELQTVYKEFGIDLAKANETGTWELPIPATYVIDKNGMIVADYVEIDYKLRLAPQIAIDALKALK